MWKYATKRKGIPCSLCPWQINSELEVKLQQGNWDLTLGNVVFVFFSMDRWVEEVVEFPALQRFPCVRHWSCPQSETEVGYPPSENGIDLLLLWITRGKPCSQGSCKKIRSMFRSQISFVNLPVTTATSTVRTHSRKRVKGATWNQFYSISCCIDKSTWPDICKVTFSA